MSTTVDHQEIETFIRELFVKVGISKQDAGYVAAGLVQASLRGVDSHGIRLVPHYLNAVTAGRINKTPRYRFEQTAPATGILDADDAFGHAAGMRAVDHAMELAAGTGMGAVTVKRSTHFGAAAFFALEIAKRDMLGFSFTHSDSLIVPTGSQQRFLGNNPICFTAPCEDEEPLCLDMATSVITFNKVLQHREEGTQVPAGVGADAHGIETRDPERIVNLLPVGGYKGYGLSLMVEVLCALLSGMPFGPHIPRMYDAPIEAKRNLGHFFMAIDIKTFVAPDQFRTRMQQLADELRREPAIQSETPVMVAGDPEKKIEARRKVEGVPLRPVDVEFFTQASKEYRIPLKIDPR